MKTGDGRRGGGPRYSRQLKAGRGNTQEEGGGVSCRRPQGNSAGGRSLWAARPERGTKGKKNERTKKGTKPQRKWEKKRRKVGVGGKRRK